SRLGLMFNALFKIPMQFFILLLGVMLFVFYLFNQPPIFFNRTVVHQHLEANRSVRYALQGMIQGDPEGPWSEADLLNNSTALYQSEQEEIPGVLNSWVKARQSGDQSRAAEALSLATTRYEASQAGREMAKAVLKASDSSIATNDSDYVFITFIL